MERGGSGGFHGYRAPPQTSSGTKLPAEMNMNTTTNKRSATTTADKECAVREQDRFMPIANVIRIMRKILPPHAKISDDAKETIQECVSEFISFVTAEANERCQMEQRKTITAEDVLWAMSKLGFDDYIEPLTLFLNRYRDLEGDQRGSIRGEGLPLPHKRHILDLGPAFGQAGPMFQLGHHNGYFGAAAGMGGYGFVKDVGSSQAAAVASGIEPYAQRNKVNINN